MSDTNSPTGNDDTSATSENKEASSMGGNAANLTGLPTEQLKMRNDESDSTPLPSDPQPAPVAQESLAETVTDQASAPRDLPDPNEPIYQAHHDNARQDMAAAFKANDANEILQSVYSKKLRVLRAGTEGAKRDTRALILEQVAMNETKDYQLRMRRELNDLGDRIFKLEAWIDMKNKEQVSEVENMMTYGFELSMCNSQLDAMRQYHSILATRILRDERYMSHRISEMATHAEANLKKQQAEAGGIN